MSARANHNQGTIAREAVARQFSDASAHGAASSRLGATIFSSENRLDHSDLLGPGEIYSPSDTSLLPEVPFHVADLMRVLRQFELTAKRQAPRIAFKAKGSILLLNLADIIAVQAEGNYVSLRHQRNSFLVHESLSSMAKKLKPYGFLRIHRSVIVNSSAVEEIQSLPSGECRLLIKGAKEYLVTRKYKRDLRDLAQLWVGSERLRR